MIQKFDCKNCNKQFEADDQQGVVTCPHCHSDNVEPARSHMPRWVLPALLVLVLAVVIGICFATCRGSDMKPDKEDSSAIMPDTCDTLKVEYKEAIPTTVEVSEPEFDGKNYSVSVEVQNAKGLKFYYVRMNHFGEKRVLQKSNDGKFSDIPFCEADGHSYDFAIMDANADTLLCVPTEKTGFIKQAAVGKKMTKEELQQLIDKRDPSLNGAGENDYLAPDYKLKFSGLPADAVNVPQILADVTDKLDMEVWQKVTVTALGYDDMNRISSITLQVVVTDF